MRVEGKDEGKDRSKAPNLYTLKEQMCTNKRTNRDKESHLIINQHHYHMIEKNNRNDSRTQ
jgi:hypothetical protein